MASPSEGNELSFERDIKPSFRTKDRDSMLQAFDLFDYEDVVEHADAIVGALRSGQMPCDGAWADSQVDNSSSGLTRARPPRRNLMKLTVNGAEVEVDDRHAKTPLLWVLRDVLGVHGVKFGCGAGWCAACTVLLDGRNTKSCQGAAERAVGKDVVTVEAASGPVVDAVRDAWHRGNVVQCGYCQPGQTLAAVALLGSNPSPDDAAVGEWMSGNLCRCGTYARIRAAIHDAAAILAAGDDPGPLTAPPEPEVHRLTAEEMAGPGHPYGDDVGRRDRSVLGLMGHEGRRLVDSPGKILGGTQFTIAVSFPGMVEGVVLHPPRFGAKVASVDDDAALAEAGVIAVVPIDAGVAVVGETVADAQRGLRALNVSWDDSGAERRSASELMAEHVRLLASAEKAVG